MVGDLPPSSNDTGIILSAAMWAMCLPVLVPPVNDTRLTNGWRVKASPSSEPLPGSTLISPLGSPASSQMRASCRASSGVISAGLITTALPAARAGATFCASLAIGEFHGVIAATTPIGSYTLMLTKSPRDGVMVSSRVSQAAAKNWKVPAALATSARVSLIGLPLSWRCSCASSSARSRISPAIRYSTVARSWGLRCAQPLCRKAWCAPCTAASTSSRLAALSQATGSPVAG